MFVFHVVGPIYVRMFNDIKLVSAGADGEQP